MHHSYERSFHISVFSLSRTLDDGVSGPHDWLGVATSHTYDPEPDTGGVLTPEQAVLAGAVMVVAEGRATAATESEAAHAALRALFFQIESDGSSRHSGGRSG